MTAPAEVTHPRRLARAGTQSARTIAAAVRSPRSAPLAKATRAVWAIRWPAAEEEEEEGMSASYAALPLGRRTGHSALRQSIKLTLLEEEVFSREVAHALEQR